MGTLQGPVIYPAVHAKQGQGTMCLARRSLLKTNMFRCGTSRSMGSCRGHIKVGDLLRPAVVGKQRIIRCSFSSSSDGSGSMAENFNENDEEYVNSSVVEAVEVRSGADGFLIKMRDGRYVRCEHNNPHGGPLPDYAPHPAIVLKMEDGSGLLLPIIVMEMPSVLLMSAVRNVQIVKLVRVTKRVHEAYFAQLYLEKVGDNTERFCFDLRPSDAINIAVRCQVPIQVNKQLAYSDGMRIVEPKKVAIDTPLSDGLLFAELDRPDGQPCIESTEFELIRNMIIAAGEERYGDAAQWRNKLTQLRSKRKNRAS